MRPRVLGFLLAGLLPVAFTGIGPPRAAGPWSGLIEDAGPLLAPLLIAAALVLVIVVLSLDFAQPRPPTGELEHLLGRKPQLFRLARRVRGSDATAVCTAVQPIGPVHVTPAPTAPPGDALEALVRLKRRGAWAPHKPGGGEGPEPPDTRTAFRPQRPW